MMKMNFSGPAQRWIEALPVGNGQLGAVVFGSHPSEHIQVNLDTIWEGKLTDRVSPTGLSHLKEIRELLFARQYAKAQQLVEQHMLYNHRLRSYQPLCSLIATATSPWGEAVEFFRELDMSTGIHRDGHKIYQVPCHREMFASMAHGVLVCRFWADVKGRAGHTIRLEREQDVHANVATTDRVVLEGQLNPDGVRFRAEALVLPEGGKLAVRGNAIEVTNADAITVILAGASSFVSADDHLGGDPAARCRELLEGVRGLSYEQLRDAHVEAHRKQMDRFSLNIETAPEFTEKAVNARLSAFSGPPRLLTDESVRPVNRPEDWDFYATILQTCRYMLVASSQPGSQPSTLQGRWCGHMNPAWNSDYHPNINLQMNYWHANVTGLHDCQIPLFDWLKEVAEKSGRDTAKRLYGCGGWVLHHVSDIFANSAPMDGPCGVWPVGGAWCCHHIWEHYQFTQDREVLRKYAPLMFDAARFMLDFLVEAPAGTPFAGRLVTAPSHSPENTFLTETGERAWISVSAAMDTQIIDQLFRDCLGAISVLGGEEQLKAQIEAARKRLPPMQVSSRSGRLMEWIEDFEEPEPGHRHLSHMFALYPGDGMGLSTTPELAPAARKSIEYRLSHDYHATGWSLPWLACMFARLHDGEKALEMLTQRIGNFTMPNAMYSNAHGQPQVGDACGYAAAVAEMLVQSHEGFILVLPALPKQWHTGEVRGLCARGGFELDISWSGGKATRVTVRSVAGRVARIVTPDEFRVLPSSAKVTRHANGTMIEFPTKPGVVYTLA